VQSLVVRAVHGDDLPRVFVNPFCSIVALRSEFVGDAITRTPATMARFLLLLGLAATWIIDTCHAAERRVALVVGAASYAHATTLAHSLDDARDIAAALKRLGFEVDLVLNPDRAATENAVRRLGQKSRGGGCNRILLFGPRPRIPRRQLGIAGERGHPE
jgi:hypothetical protein